MTKYWLALPLLFTINALFTGCATGSKSLGPTAADGSAPNEDIDHFRVNEVDPNTDAQIQKIEELEIIPTEINENVDKWISYFQNKGRVHMERYLLRSTRYEALMKKVLRDNKLPEDLFYIALIESGFSSDAFSHASAVGYWQFIRGTGKHYRLKINQLVDERRDPVLSTQAAAEYFKDLFQRFNSWYLAMAAYNVGEGRVEKVVKKYKTKDFWTLARTKRALPKETVNYVPKYIAAKLIAKNPDKYGFDGIDYMPPIEFDHINLDQPVNLRLMAEKMNINYEDFKALNPKYKGEVASLESDNTLGLRIPPGSYETASLAAKDSVAEKVEFVADQNEVQVYKIRRGDTFSNIAHRYRTTVAYLRDINDFTRKKKLKSGMKIFVPDRTPLKVKRPELASKRYHIVQKGDNIASIAKKYHVSVGTLKKLNKLKSKSKLKLGRKILLPET
jgi:membrane-bound lytic murein transglycosylase D